MFKKLSLLTIVLVMISGCAASKINMISNNKYNEWISSCNSYKDVEVWLENWNYKLTKIGRNLTPQETFELKTGVCTDVSSFIKSSLNKINPSYKAEIVSLNHKYQVTHYVCVFQIDGKIYVMDFGIGAKTREEHLVHLIASKSL